MKLALYLIENANINYDSVTIKFGRTVKISSLVNSHFIVQTTDATPSTISLPFKTIEPLTDYNQVARVLVLKWNKILQINKEYKIRLVNLVDSSNTVVPEEYLLFTTGLESATPSVLSSTEETIVSQVLVQDKSVRVEFDPGYQILAKNPDFYIQSVSPGAGEFFIASDENNGRATITFSSRPAGNFITSEFFKVQRKKIQKTPSRWETVSTRISMHSWRPIVYVDFPSNDATPSYFTDDKIYFESGYKYRIIVSSEIGI